MQRVAGRLAAALALVLAGVLGFAGCAPDRIDGRGQDGGRSAQARRASDGELAGRLYLARLFSGARSGPDGWYDRWAAGPAWRFRRVTTARTATPIWPQISPDGSRLLFADAKGHLMVRRTATPGGRLVGRRVIVPVSLAHDITVTWSPDSARLLFDGTIGARTGIWIADRDGTNLHRIVGDGAVYVDNRADQNDSAAWSTPGGIAFIGASGRRGSDHERLALYVVAPDGTGLHRVTRQFARDAFRDRAADPAWSPDARQIAYGRGSGLHVLSVAAGTERVLAHDGGTPSWSPDGQLIAFCPVYDDSRPVLVVPSDGGPARPVALHIETGSCVDLDWRTT